MICSTATMPKSDKNDSEWAAGVEQALLTGQLASAPKSRRGASMLKKWFYDHYDNPYPSEEEKELLSKSTGRSKKQISNWFVNARFRYWKKDGKSSDATSTPGGCAGPSTSDLSEGPHAPRPDDDGISVISTAESLDSNLSKISKFKPETTRVLKHWLYEHFADPYPTPEQKTVLAEEAHISVKQLNNWLINARRRIWKPFGGVKPQQVKNLPPAILEQIRAQIDFDFECLEEGLDPSTTSKKRKTPPAPEPAAQVAPAISAPQTLPGLSVGLATPVSPATAVAAKFNSGELQRLVGGPSDPTSSLFWGEGNAVIDSPLEAKMDTKKRKVADKLQVKAPGNSYNHAGIRMLSARGQPFSPSKFMGSPHLMGLSQTRGIHTPFAGDTPEFRALMAQSELGMPQSDELTSMQPAESSKYFPYRTPTVPNTGEGGFSSLDEAQLRQRVLELEQENLHLQVENRFLRDRLQMSARYHQPSGFPSSVGSRKDYVEG